MKDVYGESKLVFALNEVDFYVLDCILLMLWIIEIIVFMFRTYWSFEFPFIYSFSFKVLHLRSDTQDLSIIHGKGIRWNAV